MSERSEQHDHTHFAIYFHVPIQDGRISNHCTKEDRKLKTFALFNLLTDVEGQLNLLAFKPLSILVLLAV